MQTHVVLACGSFELIEALRVHRRFADRRCLAGRVLDKNGQRRGGKRRGAGRPKKGVRASERHKTREVFRPNQPIHVTVRVERDISSLRGFEAYRAIRAAMVSTYARNRIHIVHISIQGTHVHLLVEAPNRTALARGMQGFEIAAAKLLNGAVSKRTGKKRRGRVFCDRYHAVIIRTPKQARHELSYVLNNWRRHGENTKHYADGWSVDPFSSAPSFDGFKDVNARTIEWPDTYSPLPVWEAKTWLLTTGWKKHGLLRSTEVPGPAPKPRH